MLHSESDCVSCSTNGLLSGAYHWVLAAVGNAERSGVVGNSVVDADKRIGAGSKFHFRRTCIAFECAILNHSFHSCYPHAGAV